MDCGSTAMTALLVIPSLSFRAFLVIPGSTRDLSESVQKSLSCTFSHQFLGQNVHLGRFCTAVQPFGCLSRFERKTGLGPAASPAMPLLLRNPPPLCGDPSGVRFRWRVNQPACSQIKRDNLSAVSLALSGKRGSDPRPQPWQGCALPTELFPQVGLQIYGRYFSFQKKCFIFAVPFDRSVVTWRGG